MSSRRSRARKEMLRQLGLISDFSLEIYEIQRNIAWNDAVRFVSRINQTARNLYALQFVSSDLQPLIEACDRKLLYQCVGPKIILEIPLPPPIQALLRESAATVGHQEIFSLPRWQKPLARYRLSTRRIILTLLFNNWLESMLSRAGMSNLLRRKDLTSLITKDWALCVMEM